MFKVKTTVESQAGTKVATSTAYGSEVGNAKRDNAARAGARAGDAVTHKVTKA